MKLFRKVFRIMKKRDTTYCPFLLEQRHTVLFIFHFWSSPEFEPPHWFQTVKEAENCVLEMYPNAVIFDINVVTGEPVARCDGKCRLATKREKDWYWAALRAIVNRK